MSSRKRDFFTHVKAGKPLWILLPASHLFHMSLRHFGDWEAEGFFRKPTDYEVKKLKELLENGRSQPGNDE